MFSSNATQVSSANYIEDVFSTYLYTGNSTSGGTQTITNSIDLSTKGGMVWIKGQSAASNHILTDTTRGAGTSATNNNALASNLTSAEDLGGSSYDYLSSFSTTGFVVTQGGTTTATRGTNYNNVTYASWTFRKQAKFFDVVTYTGNGASSQAISHSLGSVPGCVIFKKTNSVEDWTVWHRSLSTDQYLILNSTSAVQTLTGLGPAAGALTSTTITVPEYLNSGSQPFVAYLFAHDAGGFGLSGSDNVISCGSYTGNGSASGPTVTLGYEPQWVLIKRTDTGANWILTDNMRGLPVDGDTAVLIANTSGAEVTTATAVSPNATGFQVNTTGSAYNASGGTYIYIAIRRGPMKVPTSGTSVFAQQSVTESTSGAFTNTMTSNFVVDMGLEKFRTGTSNWPTTTRLTGTALYTNLTLSEQTSATSYNTQWGSNTQLTMDAPSGTAGTTIMYAFQRAPSFFDEVCYTGTGGTPTTISHNLGAVPELMIIKSRSNAQSWAVYAAPLGNTNYLLVNTTAGYATSSTYWNDTTPTSSVFTVASSANVNASGQTYVAYLFASCSGVSKVGTYSGTGSTQTIDCGFASGARFVLIKRTDFTGAWYVWDTARGMVSGTDPSLQLNSTSAEVNANSIYTTTGGFQIVSTASGINASGETYIYLAIA